MHFYYLLILRERPLQDLEERPDFSEKCKNSCITQASKPQPIWEDRQKKTHILEKQAEDLNLRSTKNNASVQGQKKPSRASSETQITAGGGSGWLSEKTDREQTQLRCWPVWGKGSLLALWWTGADLTGRDRIRGVYQNFKSMSCYEVCGQITCCRLVRCSI